MILLYVINIKICALVSKDSEDDKNDESLKSRISSDSFLIILEDGIRTFMDFLKGDREKPCQVIAALFKKNRKGLVDPTRLNQMKKANHKVLINIKGISKLYIFNIINFLKI